VLTANHKSKELLLICSYSDTLGSARKLYNYNIANSKLLNCMALSIFSCKLLPGDSKVVARSCNLRIVRLRFFLLRLRALILAANLNSF
jgi:hypothetical protein